MIRRLALAGAAVALLAAGGAGAQTLRTVLSSDIRGLMPGKSPDVSTGTVLQQVYEGLVAWRADGTPAPMLAAAIDVSPDGRTYSFTLRDGVTFHNGAPLTSAAVVWSWGRFLDPASAWPCRAAFDGSYDIKVESVDAIDDRHVAFRLARPSGAFLSAMARSDCGSAGIAHPDSVDPDGSWQRAIGTGPFKLKSWTKGQSVELERFDGYRSRAEPPDGLAGAKAAQLAAIRFDIITDTAATKVALQSGALDLWAGLDPSVVKELQADPALQLTSSPLSSLYTLPMQTADPVLQDPRIRRAISLAIDRKALVDALLGGAVPASGAMVPAGSRYYGPVEQSGPGTDLDAARTLLAEAGYHGQPIVILTNRQDQVMQDTAIYVQAMLQAVGINAEVQVLEFATQFQRYYSGNYQMMVWNLTSYLDPIFLFERFIGDKSKQADKVWDDPKARALLTRLFAAETPEARQPVFDDLHRLFLEDAPLVVWAPRVSFAATRGKVEGFQPWPGGLPRLWNVTLTR